MDLTDATHLQLTTKSRAKHWCLTINNPTAADVSMFANIQELTMYTIYGEEVGSTGNQHLQCYIAFHKQTTLATLKKYFPRCHAEIARGTPQQAADYCKKDGKYVETGTIPGHQGANGGQATQVIRIQYLDISTGNDDFERIYYSEMDSQLVSDLVNGFKEYIYDNISYF